MSERRIGLTTLALVCAAAAAPYAVRAQDWQTIASSRKLSNESALKVDVEYAAGHMNIEPDGGSSLYRANLRYDADIFKNPVLAYSNGTLKVSMSDGNVRGRKDMKAGKLDLGLSNRVPLDLDVSFGAAEATLDLTGLMVRNAVIHTGASETKLVVSKRNPIVCESLDLQVGAARFEAKGLGNLNARKLDVSGGVGEVVLDFSGSAAQDLAGTISMGLGSLTLRVPRGVGLQVTKSGLLSSFDSEGLVKRGNTYMSENYSRSRRHISLDINAAFGAVNVEWVDQ